MTANNKKQQKQAAAVCVIATAILCIVSWVGVWQTRYQVVSDLIPDTVVAAIQRPFRVAGIVLLLVTGLNLLCYLQKKYIIVIVTGIATVVAWKVYFILSPAH